MVDEDGMPLVAMISDKSAMMDEVNTVTNTPKGWWVDTGATRHVCADKSLFTTFKALSGEEKLYMGNAATADIMGEGTVILKWTSGKELTLSNVLYVPDLRKNLVSGWLLNKFGFRLVFESDQFVLTKRGTYVGKGYAQNGMFKLNVMAVKNMNKIATTSTYMLEFSESNKWHGRLGHVNFNSIRRLINLNCIPTFHIDSHYKCETCVESKLTRTSSKSVERITEPLDLIHTDICDLKAVPTTGGNKYFITFIDDSTKYCYVYLLKSKDEAISKFILYKNEVENQLQKKIKALRSDRGGEYVAPFAELCAKSGIVHECTPPYSPQSNGVAERKNRTLKEMMNAMLISSGVSHELWGEAILSANYLLNRIPLKKRDETPYELWKRKKPSYKYLKVWGCLAKVTVPPPKALRIGPKTVDCIFIGYAHQSSAHRFLVHESKNPDVHVNTIMEVNSNVVSYFENVFPLRRQTHATSSTPNFEVGESSSTPVDEVVHDKTHEQPEVEETDRRRSKRPRVEKSFGPDFVSYMVEGEPNTYREAVSSSEGPQWKEAIRNEIDSILQNHTWELVDLPPGCKPLGYRWIFKRKMKTDGSIDKYKARLVIKGFRQKEGLDYFDTYSPVTRITSIRLVLAIAALRNLEVHQMDVKTAFLNGDLEEEIYMEQPEGFSAPGQEGKVCKLVKNLEVHQMDVKTAFLNGDLEEEIYMEQPEGFSAPGQEGKVCKLVKSLYGLKQAPKQWHQKFDHVMIDNGFKINECDKCVYFKDTNEGYVILCLYVDDMLIIGSNDKIIKATKSMLKARFDMKDMGLADVILGVKIIRTQEGLVLSQSHYVDKILEKFNSGDTSVARTPVDTSQHLKKNKGDGVAQLEYSRIIGSLMYLMTCTRPDLAYAVSRLSRYTSNPCADHWKAITRVLRYIRYTRDYGLHYTRQPAVIEGYTDANWISDNKDSKSTSGYVFTLGGAAIAWKSSKQTVIARSTMESEFIALDKSGEEAEWLRQFVEDIPRWPKPLPAICVHCDSQSAIGRAQSLMYNGRSRHMRRRHNTIRQLLSTGVITIDYVRSADNIADPFTKGLSRELVETSSRGMGLKPVVNGNMRET
ncbi:putative RNA-directed DNA polymerase [Helianthus annuus]|nr:putative RNA-directed DNA polymerase [Helianthus annuus]